MPVFNLYIKILKKYILSLLIYVFVFVGVAFIITNALGNQSNSSFTAAKTKVALINSDTDSPLLIGLKNYLSINTVPIDLSDSDVEIQDALFLGNVDVVLRVPTGFAQHFLSGSRDLALQKMAGAPSAGSVSVDLLVDRYFTLTSMYLVNKPGIAEEDAVAGALEDLQKTARVDPLSTEGQNTLNLSYYFSYIAYSLLAILLMGVTTIMLSLKESSLEARNNCSPISPARASFQLFLGNAAFGGGVWVILCVMVFIMYGRFSPDTGTLLLCLNALVFTVVGLSIGFLAGKLIRSRIAQAAVTNVVALGISFISGVFVEQALLGDMVLKIASFTPGYWYVRAVNSICDVSVFSFTSIQPVVNDMLIQLGFAAVLFVIALLVSKQQRQSLVVRL